MYSTNPALGNTVCCLPQAFNAAKRFAVVDIPAPQYMFFMYANSRSLDQQYLLGHTLRILGIPTETLPRPRHELGAEAPVVRGDFLVGGIGGGCW